MIVTGLGEVCISLDLVQIEDFLKLDLASLLHAKLQFWVTVPMKEHPG